MIFYKLPKIAKKISILAGRIKNLVKLIEKGILKNKYVIQVLEAEDKISELEKVRNEVSLTKGVKQKVPLTPKVNKNNLEKLEKLENNHITPKQLAEDFSLYLKLEENNLLEYLEKWGIKVVLSEMFDDCLSVLTDKGHVMLDVNGWEVTCINQKTFKSRFLDLVIASLWYQEDRVSAWS